MPPEQLRTVNTDVVPHLAELASERSYAILRNSDVFPWINFEEARQIRIAYLSDHSFVNFLNESNKMLRRNASADTLANIHSRSHDSEIMVRKREEFINSLLPITISLLYQPGSLYNRFKYCVLRQDFLEVEDLIGSVYLELVETVTRFHWSARVKHDAQIPQFIASLKKSLKNVLKPKPYEKTERTLLVDDLVDAASDPFSQEQKVVDDLSLSFIISTELPSLLTPQALTIMDLLVQGYTRVEILAKTGISEPEYAKLRHEINAAVAKAFDVTIGENHVSQDTLKVLFAKRSALLSPREKEVARLVLEAPEDQDPYTYVAQQSDLSRENAMKYWSTARQTLLSIHPTMRSESTTVKKQLHLKQLWHAKE